MNDVLQTTCDEGERTFKELADNAPVMIWRSDADGLWIWLNKPWLEFTGRTMEQEIGSGWSEGIHPDDFERCLQTYLGAFEARRAFALIFRLRRADGVYRQVLDNGKPFYRDGAFAGYFGSCVDVTEQMAAETQLRQAKKMEAIGHLTGGVAHDFNNLLQVIGGNLELLSKDLPDDSRAQRRLRHALDAVGLGAKLSSHLLAYARRQALKPTVLHIGRLIQEMDPMLRGAMGDAVEIETRVDQDLWNTRVDPVQLETALLNLAINARDAMNGRGRLTIHVRNAAFNGEAGRHADPGLGECVALAVTDVGAGMSPETIDRVFDPFFTTKGEGLGTGLGLSMVHGFVHQSGGHVSIDSQLGRGTTVRIFLPRSYEPEADSADLDPSDVAGGCETILLVEDDDRVRATTADTLAGLGYAVIEAHDGDNGARIVDSGVHFDVLLTDVVMPGSVRAPELARKAQKRRPGTGVLFTSGYAYNRLVEEGALENGAELLSKPYTREDLARTLRRVLANRKSSAGRTPAAK